MDNTVMFTAVADLGGNYGPYDADRTLVFNAEITNVGEAYDITSGYFKAPVSGYYYFTFFYKAGKDHKSGLTLMKNKEVIVRSFDDTEKGPGFTDNAGNAVFLQLKKGDKVYLRLPGNNHIYGTNCTTTFSGFLVSQL